jgi:hypothetical protein
MKLLPLLLALALLPAGALADPKTDDAVKAAGDWLKLVDAAQYKESWTEAATFFKERVKEEDWIKMVELARKPFGEVQDRKLLKATPTAELPGAPDGEYVVIQFQTAFSRKKNSVETITPMKEPGGSWRVSGYYIK